jgi:hypothetical protein
MEKSMDIHIDTDQSIRWIDFDAESVEPLEIDVFIQPLNDFFKKLEICCMSECFGIDAFILAKGYNKGFRKI